MLKQCQFKIVEESICEDYDQCVLVVKAVKPGLIPTGEIKSPEQEVQGSSLANDAIKNTATTTTSTTTGGSNQQPGPSVNEGDLSDTRPLIKIFVSYSTKDSANVKKLLDKLREYLGASKGFRYELWKDNDSVLLGEKWDAKIQEAITECDFGLLLVSPNFLGSEYVAKKELNTFCEQQRKPILPVLLKEIDTEKMNLRGLQDWQIFALVQDEKRSAYTSCYGARKEQFVHKLFGMIEMRIQKQIDG